MRRAIIVTGVLGLGTTLVFAAAVMAATLLPNGATIAAGPGQWWATNGGVVVRGGAPIGGPVEIGPGLDANGGIAMPEEGPALAVPGTVVLP